MARILVVDDSPAITLLIQEVLSAAGHDIETAADGREGLEHFLRSRHDLIVTDIVMPEMDGLELVAAVRRVSSATPVIVVTSGGAEVAPELFLRNATLFGAHWTLAKPLQPDQLLEAVHGLLERRRQPARRPAPGAPAPGQTSTRGQRGAR